MDLAVHERAMEETKEISITDLMKIFMRGKLLILLCVLLSLAGAGLYVTKVVNEYQSTCTLLVDPIKQSSTIGTVLSSDFFDTNRDITTEIQLITNITNLNAALGRLDLSAYTTTDGRSYSEPEVLGNLRGKITVQALKDTNIVEITVRDQNPAFAADCANALAVSFNSMLSDFSKDSKQAQLEFLKRQIPTVEQQLQEANERLYDYRLETGIDFLSNSTSSLVNHISYLNVKKLPLVLQMEKSDALLQEFHERYGTAVPTLGGYTADAELGEITESYQKVFEELILYEVVSNNDFRNTTNQSVVNEGLNTTVTTRVSQLNSQLHELRRYLRMRVTAVTEESLVRKGAGRLDREGLEEFFGIVVERLTSASEVQVISQIIYSFEHEFNQLPLIEKELSKLVSDVDSLEAIRKELNSFSEQITLTAAAESRNVKIVSPAVITTKPVSPDRRLIFAVSVLLGGALGVLLSLLLHMMDTAIHTLEEIQGITGPEIPILGWIPLLKRSNEQWEERRPPGVRNDHQSYLIERYSQITSNIVYGKNKGHTVFLITSSGINEQKSSAAVNIGICLEKMGHRVLIIDSDTRFPSIERTYGLEPSACGYISTAEQGLPFERSIMTTSDDTPGLHMAVPGHRSMVSPFGHTWTLDAASLQQIRSEYDYVLIDGPPITFAAEQLRLADQADALLVCVRMNICGKQDLRRLLLQLDDHRSKIGGIIATACTKKNIFSYGYTYNTYSSYHTDPAAAEFVSSERAARRIFTKEMRARGTALRR